ncbi:hypothetical protein CFIO01_02323 [Colletotrichum fioriniae PJ7]|uniref:Uncharacterized protein n=1 Tax=Colletotrichum fioriniae PJ7 TaxID=1445577 RepID=A0A010QX57_9PEZI|nr:hypothetical protein CFIO01_02323 [Colletotrichum fioriniae PJ7]
MHVAYVWRLPLKSSAFTNIKSPHGDEEQWLCGLRSSHGRLVSGQSGTAAGVAEDKLRSSMRLLKANPVDPPTRFVPRIPHSMEDSHFLRGHAFEFLNRPTGASHLVEPLYTTLRAVLRRDEQRSSFRLPRRNSPTCYPYKDTFADLSATYFWLVVVCACPAVSDDTVSFLAQCWMEDIDFLSRNLTVGLCSDAAPRTLPVRRA